MRRSVLLAAIALAGCGGGGERQRPEATAERSPEAEAAPATAGERRPQPERYALELAYDARRCELSGSERIALRNTGPAPLASVWLRTWGNAFGGCGRRYVRVEVAAGARAGADRVGCTALELRLARPLEPGASTTAGLQIRVTAPRRPDRFGRFTGAAFFGNALPLVAVADADGCEPPRGRPRLTAPMKAFGRSDYRRVVYVGGMSALTTIERRLGPGRFDRMLRGLVEEHRDGILTTADFVAAVQDAAPSGVDASALLRRAGISSAP